MKATRWETSRRNHLVVTTIMVIPPRQVAHDLQDLVDHLRSRPTWLVEEHDLRRMHRPRRWLRVAAGPRELAGTGAACRPGRPSPGRTGLIRGSFLESFRTFIGASVTFEAPSCRVEVNCWKTNPISARSWSCWSSNRGPSWCRR